MAVGRRCPECGGEMLAGSAGVNSYLGGLSWHKDRSGLALHGETIVSKPLGGIIWLDGFRCPNCRLLYVRY